MKRCCTALALGLAASVAGAATPIYRCGQTYSQMPCAGGHIIDSSDPRTAAQRAEARRIAEREKELAARMERERRQQAAAAATPTGHGAASAPAAPGASAPAKGARRAAKAAKAAGPAASGQGVVFIAPRPAKK